MSLRWFRSGLATTAAGLATLYANDDRRFDSVSAQTPSKQSTSSIDDPEEQLERARAQARLLIANKMAEGGFPGLSISVHKNGRSVWSTGFGYADVENGVPMRGNSVMRVASVSKPLTMTAVARAVEAGLLDMNAGVHKYLPNLPPFKHNSATVEITMDQLVRHRAGVRHYFTKQQLDRRRQRKLRRQQRRKTERESKLFSALPASTRGIDLAAGVTDLGVNTGDEDDDMDDDEELLEFHLREPFESVHEALQLFINDELISQPGEQFNYTTHGWTLISAVLEAATGRKFESVMKQVFCELGLDNTYLDRHKPIIPHRARYYTRGRDGRLYNAVYVDTSYKWAGGGMLSSTADLCRFADILLYAWQHRHAPSGNPVTAGYLRADTVAWLWQSETAASSCKQQLTDTTATTAARGWFVTAPRPSLGSTPAPDPSPHGLIYHTGAAVGCSSVLVVLPSGDETLNYSTTARGVTVAVAVNLQAAAGLKLLATQVGRLFCT